MKKLILALSATGLLSSSTAYTQACGNLFSDLKKAQISALRRLADVKELTFMTYNVENLFVHVGKFERTSPTEFKKKSDVREKPEYQVAQIQKVIDEVSPDILTIQEVENIEAENHLAEKLKDKYRTFLIEGNDARGIDIGFLVKADLPLDVREISHKDDRWNDPVSGKVVPLYSRDLPVLEFRLNQNQKDPSFVLIGNHAKSKRDRPGDPESKKYRAAQYEGAAKVVSEYLKRGIKVIFAGDFNLDVRDDPDLGTVRDILISAFDAAPDTVPVVDRITETYHPRNGPAVKSQLDDIRVSPDIKDQVVSAKVVPYRNPDGSVMPVPETFEQRKRQPSDHRPVTIKISTKALFGT